MRGGTNRFPRRPPERAPDKAGLWLREPEARGTAQSSAPVAPVGVRGRVGRVLTESQTDICPRAGIVRTPGFPNSSVTFSKL